MGSCSYSCSCTLEDLSFCRSAVFWSCVSLCYLPYWWCSRNAFITLKDHKDNFTRNLPCRLINPSKSEMGRVAKAYLDKIVQDITAITNANQWRNTSSVIQWFNSIKCKSKSRFIKFDIAEFYPSISEDLLNSSLKYASGFTTIPDKAITIIKHARRSLLFD